MKLRKKEPFKNKEMTLVLNDEQKDAIYQITGLHWDEIELNTDFPNNLPERAFEIDINLFIATGKERRE